MPANITSVPLEQRPMMKSVAGRLRTEFEGAFGVEAIGCSS